jgi:hypothetical protein
MSEPIRYESIQEPLDEEERVLMDPDTWDWDTLVEVVVHPNPGAILPIRFTCEEVVRLQRLAHAEGMTTHAFIKQAALACRRMFRASRSCTRNRPQAKSGQAGHSVRA